MELDHNHSCPLHGKRRFALFFFPHLDLLRMATATRRIDTVKVLALQRVLKVAYVCSPGLFCLLSGEIQALDL